MNRKISTRIVLSTLLLATLLPAAAACAQSEPPEEALASITAGELRGLLRYYASDWFEGRAVGTRGYDMAAAFLASQLEASGVKPGGPDGSYFQEIELVRYGLSEDIDFALSRAGTALGPFEAGVDYEPGRGYSDWSMEGELVFAGFGISAPEKGWDDYAGLDVKDKVVVVVELFPGFGTEENPLGDRREAFRYASPSAKARAAAEHGAIGIIRVPHPRMPERTRINSKERMMRLSSPRLPERLSRETFPQVTVGPAVAGAIFDAGALAEAVQKMESTSAPVQIGLRGLTVKAHAVMRHETVPSRNVLGMIEGTDLKEEGVLIGAHADHVGSRGEEIYNGADDDGSGSVVLLELAEAFASTGIRPRRTIIFGWWMGEEIGLYGSWYYARHPVIPLEKTVALIQMDMIGRNEEYDPRKSRGLPEETAEQNANSVNCIGYSYSTDMQRLIERANEPIGLEVKFRYDAGSQNLLRRSDHWSFLQLGVPIAFLFTGIHPDYHEPTDTWDKINYPKMERIARLAFRAAWELATTDDPPSLNPDVKVGGGN